MEDYGARGGHVKSFRENTARDRTACSKLCAKLKKPSQFEVLDAFDTGGADP